MNPTTYNLKPKTSGFTLIEIIIYTLIFAIVILGIVSFMLFATQSRIKNQVVAEVEQQGTQVMQLITQTIRNGTGINSPTIGSSSNSLSVEVIEAGLDPTVFDLASGVFRITEGAGSATDLTSDQISVTSLNFENNTISGTDDTIKIEYTIEYNNPETDIRYDYSKTFYGSATRR
ncbi:MAG: prepilin-type N-terminal cleavage/methylation domain-containing protein [Candidatus Uhrbacteria bacterium]